MFRSAPAAVSVALIVFATLISQEREAVLSGKLIGPDSIPLHRARVTIVGSGVSATTDSSGSFSMRHTLTGTQTIELVHLDFETLVLPPIRIPQTTLSIKAMLQRSIPAGPRADSARAAMLTRGGRGLSNTAMVVVDGVIRDNPMRDSAQNNLPTQVDIVSIDILTGTAAMQMFGSRARNGVISIESCFPARAARGPCR